MKTEEEVARGFWKKVVKSFADSRKVPGSSREKDNDTANLSFITNGTHFYNSKYNEEWLASNEKLFTSLKNELEKIFSPENIVPAVSTYNYWNINCSCNGKFLTLEKHWGDFFLKFHYDNEREVGCVLDDDVPIMNVVEIFRDFKNEYESNCKKLEKLILERRKAEKIKEMAETSIENMLKNIFANCAAEGKSYKYNLIKKNDKSTALQVKLHHKKMVEIMLPHKNFAEIKQLPEQLKKIEQLLEELSFPVNIKTYGNNIKWLEV